LGNCWRGVLHKVLIHVDGIRRHLGRITGERITGRIRRIRD